MSSTAKTKLQALFTTLDETFAKVHPDDVPEMITEIRRDLATRKAGRASGYDTKHLNAATAAAVQ